MKLAFTLSADSPADSLPIRWPVTSLSIRIPLTIATARKHPRFHSSTRSRWSLASICSAAAR
jgi:hypothetical protein